MKTIGVLTSSSAVSKEALAEGIAYWENRGYRVRPSEHLYAKNRFSAGTDVERANDLNALFADDEIDMIIEACGGYGSARFLDKVDYDMISRHKKPFIGLSDTTALQLALLAKAGLPSFSGYLMKPRNGRAIFPYTESSLFDALEGRKQVFTGLETAYNGPEIKGKLIGGCLSLVASLVGTPYLPDMSGAVVVLEDVCEEPYRIDRMMLQLSQSGMFDRAAALVFGCFLDCRAKDPADGTVEEVIREWRSRLAIPVFSGLPYGHQAGSAVIPVGAEVVLSSAVLRVLKRGES